MTCIVGYVDAQQTVWIGGDSAGLAGWDRSIRRDPKVFRRGGLLFGFTSSFRLGQLLRYSLHVPPHPEGKDPYEYVAVDLVESVRSCLRSGGYTRIDSNEERGGTFLVGYRGHLFQIGSDFQVAEREEPYDAVGCGESYALGALWQLTRGAGSPDAQRIVLDALAAAARFSAGVAPPFLVAGITIDGSAVPTAEPVRYSTAVTGEYRQAV